jgi:hypothetical protein
VREINKKDGNACVAKNDFGENKTTCRINVKGENEPIPVPKKKPWCKVV